MSGSNEKAPIIIKRKKVVAGGHHGGAWKVAYADFVTAMMAFFMLMWLLNATTEKQRKGIADYFSPTIALARVSGGGDGALGGDSVLSERTLPYMGSGSTSLKPQPENGAAGFFQSGETEQEKNENEDFRVIEELLMGRGGESMVADEALEHIVTKVTDEGLVIEFFETDQVPLFARDGSPTPLLVKLSKIIVEASRLVANPIAIEGHTSAYPIVLADNPSWGVSEQRATEFRRLLAGEGFKTDRINRVTSHGDREPARTNRMDTRNNRIEIVFLRDV